MSLKQMTTLVLVKRAIKVLLGIAAAGLLVFAFIPEPVKVDMFTVARDTLLVTLEGEGKTRIHDIYTVYAPIDGRITRIESEPGDRVTAGETVIANMFPANPQFLDKRRETQARADIEGARAALSLAKARVKQARAELEFELSDFTRTEQLYRQQTVSQAHLERAQLRIKTLRAELETALSNQEVMESRLAAARAMLVQPEEQEETANGGNCHICIHSPVDGRVLRILHKSESIVAVGTPLVEIGNPADLEVSIEMLSTNAVKVKTGDDALIKRWGGDRDIRARVRLIEPSGFTKISALGVEEQRVNVILAFTDAKENWQALGDAFRVEAAIITDKAENVLTVPLSALFRQEEKWSVFKVVDGYVVLQQVGVGRRNDRFAEITSGLVAGERVISYPGNKVAEGVRVVKR